MTTAHKAARILNFGDGHAPGYLRVDASGTILDITSQPKPEDQVIDHGNTALLPGGVNVHNHCKHSKRS